MARLWLLNLDAELELDKPAGYQSPQVLRRQMSQQRRQLSWLVGDEAVWDEQSRVPRGTEALCWSPTPSALRRWRRYGQELAAPSIDVLQQVNCRRLLVDFDRAGLERAFVDADGDLGWLEMGRSWRLKRAFGFAGKGQRVLRGVPSADDRRWVADSLRRGLLREREVQVVEEWSLHGYVDATGCLWGQPCRQRTDAQGRVVELSRAELASGFRDALMDAGDSVRAALELAGYWGPFGIDAFVFEGDTGVRFNPVSDINARFSLGWSIGMGERREAALERLLLRSIRG